MPLPPTGTGRGTQLPLHYLRPCPGVSPCTGNQLFFWQLILEPKIKSAIPRIPTFPGESQRPKGSVFPDLQEQRLDNATQTCHLDN